MLSYHNLIVLSLGQRVFGKTASEWSAGISAIGDTCEIIGIIPGTGTSANNPPVPTCTDPAQSITTPIAVDNSAVVSALQTADNQVVFFSGGFEIDKNNFKLITEAITSRFIHSELLPKQRSYFASLGYSIGKVTPMLTFGHVDESSSAPDATGLINNPLGSGVPVATEGPYVVALPTSLYVSNLVNSQRTLSDYYEFGLRWDTSIKTAIKLDFTRYLNRSGPYMGLEGPVDPYTGVNLLSAAFVFVF